MSWAYHYTHWVINVVNPVQRLIPIASIIISIIMEMKLIFLQLSHIAIQIIVCFRQYQRYAINGSSLNATIDHNNTHWHMIPITTHVPV
jgi:hypothetical protein